MEQRRNEEIHSTYIRKSSINNQKLVECLLKTVEEVVVVIQEAQEKLNAEFAKTTKVSQKKARLISHQLTRLYKEFQALSIAQE